MLEIFEFIKTNVFWVVAFFLVLYLLLNEEPQKKSSAAISPADLSHKINQGSFVYDVRKKSDFEKGHVRGSVHIALAKAKSIIVEQLKSKESSHCCVFIGQDDVIQGLIKDIENPSEHHVHYLKGGVDAWTQAGFKVEKSDIVQ